jgi:two-component system chemotaxis response regulator CheB
MQTRDVVVIGSSMGGVEALKLLVAQFPEDLPASVSIVQHIAESSPGVLAGILEDRGPLPAFTATDGMPMERGRIYVAPANRHLLVTRDCIRVVFGPRENRSRPAIDPLFRTAAVHFGSRVIGVVLTGLQDDGASGLQAIVRCGGTAVVQSPDDAAYPEMPKRALEYVEAARVAALGDIGPLIVRLCREPAPESPPVPEGLRLEARLTERASQHEDWTQLPGRPVGLTCPECAGALEEIDAEEGEPRYRCRVGHAFSVRDLNLSKKGQVEDGLWLAIQTLEERSTTLANLADVDRKRGWERSAEAFDARARESHAHAARLRGILNRLPE